MQQHGDESHIGQLFIVAYTGTANSRHQVAAKEAELRLGVLLLQLLHQVRRMQVTTGLTSYQIIFHCS